MIIIAIDFKFIVDKNKQKKKKLRFIFVSFFHFPFTSLTPKRCIGKFASLRFVQHASDGSGRGYVSLAHCLLYLNTAQENDNVIYFIVSGEISVYRIRPNYRTYPYKRTVKQFRCHQITASVFSLYFFIKAYVVGTHLNCIDLSMQFKWVPTTYAFIKKIRKETA